ncbi:MAG TPA: 23S rRNA (guanosine(2251)-2'-O)-methyltransferase RlmB [Acidimicrobiales bacterium]|nr:23S rRNA (guanosine(2251)-2'-O)-methyltransferase RlmB [Acidimicrobiales bacterium]
MSKPRPARRGRPPRRGSTPGPRGLGGEQVEGRQAVAELLAARRRRVVDVWVDADAPPAPVLIRIADLAERAGVPVRRVGGPRLAAEARTESPQGVLAHARPLPEADLDELCRPLRSGHAGRAEEAFLLALDGVTDPQNLGGLLRTAEGAGVTGAILPRHRAVHVTPAVTKAAAGAVEHVPLALVGGLPAALARARESGVWVVGLDPDADESLYDLGVADQPVAVVLGAEGRGLSRLVRERCDVLVGIPLRGRIPSLNVAAAGALALFEVSRRRGAR